MTVALSVGSVVFVALFGWASGTAVRHLRHVFEALRGIETLLREREAALETVFSERLKLVEQDVEGLPRKWEAIKREAAAAETRARYHANRAITELEEHGLTSPGLEGLARDLQLNDGRPGPEEGVPAMPEGVESGPEADDWRSQTLRRKYG